MSSDEAGREADPFGAAPDDSTQELSGFPDAQGSTEEGTRGELRPLGRDPLRAAIEIAAHNAERDLFGPGEPHFEGTSRFRILRRIGSGGFGTVYEAFDNDVQSTVALKALHSATPEALLQFKREFRTLADVAHENVVRMYELFSDGAQWFFTMELVDGQNFVSSARRAPDRLPDLFRQLAAGISTLHEAGILHCDLKPGNVLVTPSDRVVILDFGLVRDAASHSRQPLCGTPAYMSPEQAMGQALTSASDWYSAGLMLYEAISGKRLFDSSTVKDQFDRRERDSGAFSALMSSAEPALARLCLDMLHFDPLWRPGAGEIAARIGTITPATQSHHPPEEIFVGRRLETSALEEAFGISRAHAVLQYVTGPPGIGKSKLCAHFTGDLKRRGDLVFSGRCRERESVPFKAFDDLVEGIRLHLGSLPSARAEEVLGKDLPLIGQVFPTLAAGSLIPNDLRYVDPIDRRTRAFDAIGRFLHRLAGHNPLVLWIDDAQWGDRDSANLILHLMNMTEPLRLLLLLSFRDEDAQHSEFIRALLSGLFPSGTQRVAVRTVSLTVLSHEEAAELAGRALGASAAPDHVDGIARQSAGDPFLVMQFARMDAAHRTNPPAPDEAESLFSYLVEGLPRHARDLLEVSAVAARPVRWHILRAVADAEHTSYSSLLLLQSKRLVRVSGSKPDLMVEVYHNRIKEAVRAALDFDRLRHLHRGLAFQIESTMPDDAESIAVHYFEAGDCSKARPYAVTAGNRASEALAFDAAARFYQMALQGPSLEEDLRQSVEHRLAESLANAGRASDAAEVYLRLAGSDPSRHAIELRLIAARNLLASGHTERGFSVLGGILETVGMRMPRSPTIAVINSILIRLTAWGEDLLRMRPRGPTEFAFMQIETCWTISSGLGISEPAYAADFQARHLRIATACGTPYQQARAFALEAAFLAALGKRFRKRSRTMIARAYRLSSDLPDKRALALTEVASSVCAALEMKWRTAVERVKRVEPLLNDHCPGSSWELATAKLTSMRSLYYLGEIREVWQRLPDIVKDAEARGDVYLTRPLLARLSMLEVLTSDDHTSGRAMLPATDNEDSSRYQLWQYLVLLARLDIEFYCGNFESAWTLMDRAWNEVRTAQFLRIPYLGIEARSRRGFAAVHQARVHGSGAARFTRIARRELTALENLGFHWSDGIASAMRAALSVGVGDTHNAMDLLLAAERSFERAEMASSRASAQYQRAQLMGGEAGMRLAAAAEDWMRMQGIKNPARAARLFLPVL